AKKPAAKKQMSKRAAPARGRQAKKAAAPALKKLSPEHLRALHDRLAATLPTPIVELAFDSPWQLLVATILSAQSTDKMVNTVTPALFARFPTPAALGAADQAEVETLVKSTGFFRNKAKAIREASRIIAERFGGEVPRTMEELLELPGVARKTANVVLGSAYRIPTGITVDTHAGRVARRLGLTAHEDPVKVEQDLCAAFPKESWIDTGHRLVLHGRHLCTARNPDHARCPLFELCPSAEGAPEGEWRARADDERALVDARRRESMGR
ncbi:MAG: endonuclease III, partial [Myxococcales bacterium]